MRSTSTTTTPDRTRRRPSSASICTSTRSRGRGSSAITAGSSSRWGEDAAGGGDLPAAPSAAQRPVALDFPPLRRLIEDDGAAIAQRHLAHDAALPRERRHAVADER